MPAFERYIGVDYSGAAKPTTRLPGLRVYVADQCSPPIEIRPPGSPGRHWTRQSLADWLAERLSEDRSTLVGIDHAFSFPRQYFERYELSDDWRGFLEDFQRHWPTDKESVEDVRRSVAGTGSGRIGNTRWRRLTEERSGAAKSVFHFDVPGSVAKSTHSGLPWLRHLSDQLGDLVHFWPFDGWSIPSGRSALVEVYPRLFSYHFLRDRRNEDQHDAYSVAEWTRRADLSGRLGSFFEPQLTDQERTVAAIEGWILGVGRHPADLAAALGEGDREDAPGFDCPFCDITADRIFHESRLLLAIWDNFPVSPGHALLVPRRHVPTWFEATPEERQELSAAIETARAAILTQHSPDGFNVGMNLGAAAGQTVGHLHLHVIPRYAGDVPDPRGGVRWVVPERADYWSKR